MSEECKTLEAYLAPPTQHKQRKLNNEHYRYETLLRESFEARNELEHFSSVRLGQQFVGSAVPDIGEVFRNDVLTRSP